MRFDKEKNPCIVNSDIDFRQKVAIAVVDERLPEMLPQDSMTVAPDIELNLYRNVPRKLEFCTITDLNLEENDTVQIDVDLLGKSNRLLGTFLIEKIEKMLVFAPSNHSISWRAEIRLSGRFQPH